MAILREQGVNGQVEMAAAFDCAGFETVDVHMSDLLSGRMTLETFQGVVACGGFSYGDVLGAGVGWARSIRFNPRAFDVFSSFFGRGDTFGLGVCNGCQMMASLRDLIPGATGWPRFVRNTSEQFEARLSLVRIESDSPSLLLQGMEGAILPIAVAHGEGRADRRLEGPDQHLAALRRPRGTSDGIVSSKSKWFAGRTRWSDHRRRTFYDHDAPSRARVSNRPTLLAPRIMGSRIPVAAPVSKCTPVDRLMSPRQNQGEIR
jgi:phosphoribosylformylglycinamidine (FGAM) synthase-like amidotransferase family enzyme